MSTCISPSLDRFDDLMTILAPFLLHAKHDLFANTLADFLYTLHDPSPRHRVHAHTSLIVANCY
jgi:hypothetical protein